MGSHFCYSFKQAMQESISQQASIAQHALTWPVQHSPSQHVLSWHCKAVVAFDITSVEQHPLAGAVQHSMCVAAFTSLLCEEGGSTC